MYGALPKKAHPGEWLRVPYSGHPLARIDMKIGTEEWKACYHDEGDVMVRTPFLEAGEYEVSLRQDLSEAVRLGVVVISVGGSPNVSVRTRSSK